MQVNSLDPPPGGGRHKQIRLYSHAMRFWMVALGAILAGCVELAPPEAHLSVPDEVTVEQAFMADARESKATDRPIARYHWEFSDGTPTLITSSPITTHKFRLRGEYAVSVIVEDTEGNMAVAESYVRVVLDFQSVDGGGVRRDGGRPGDGGRRRDGSPDDDGGTPRDGGRPRDGGSLDIGESVEAGPHDGNGWPDVGLPPPDAAVVDDASVPVDAGAGVDSGFVVDSGYPPTCFDGVKNGDETDIDCGGACCGCQSGWRCDRDVDCTTGGCFDGFCHASGGGFFTLQPVTGVEILELPRHIISGNANQDCRTDLMVAGNAGRGVMAFVSDDNQGVLVAQTVEPPDAQSDLWSGAMGDFTGDLVPDLAVNQESNFELHILEGPYSPESTNWRTFFMNKRTTNALTGDYNGDDVTDLALLGAGQVIHILGSANGPNVLERPPLPIETDGVLLADVDQDGRDDFIFIDTQTDQLHVVRYLSNDTVSLESQPLFGTSAVAVIDIFGDGFPDVVAADTGGQLTSYVNFNGALQMTAWTMSVNAFPTGMSAGDINADGLQDLVMILRAEPAVVRVLVQSSGNLFSTYDSWETCSTPSVVHVADVTMDGRPDVAVGCSIGELHLYLNVPTDGP